MMFDAGWLSDTAPETRHLPRARGEIRVSVKADPPASRLATLRQSGSAKGLLPRLPGRPDEVEAVLINTAGGITGGDRFSYAAEVAPGAALTVTTQAAERIYRSAGGVGRLEARLTLGKGGRLDWLPQETILFDHAALERRLEVDMAAYATLLVLEAVILGRAAMGETVAAGHLSDQWRIRRDGRLVHAEALRLSGPVAEIAARPGCWGGAGAAATLLYVAPDAADRLAPLRACLPQTAGASAWEGKLVARILAPSAQSLRTTLTAALAVFRPHLPAVWSS
ncbi:MAG: urease accessory protein UreD [Pseudomonadota bacterium]